MADQDIGERIAQLRRISSRLVWTLVPLVVVGIAGAFIANAQTGSQGIPTPTAVFLVGVVGGFVGLQRRLKSLPAEDLTLLANSWVCVILSPLAGAILAELIYLLFVSNLLSGELFPKFVPDGPDLTGAAGAATLPGTESATAPGGNAAKPGFKDLFKVHCPTSADYAKVLFWSFVAGFSERFATNIIGQFDSRASGKSEAEGQN